MKMETISAEFARSGTTFPQERRAFPRHLVDCPVEVCLVTGAGRITGRMFELSLGGCRIETEHPFHAVLLSRVEVQFPLRGIVFQLAGVTVGSRVSKSFAVRFLDITEGRLDELSEVIDEVAAVNAAKAAEAGSELAMRLGEV